MIYLRARVDTFRQQTSHACTVTGQTQPCFICRSVVRNNSLYLTTGRMFLKQEQRTCLKIVCANSTACIQHASVFKVLMRRFRITLPNGTTQSQDCPPHSQTTPGHAEKAPMWVPHDLTEIQKWLLNDAANAHLESYEREGDAFLRHIITLKDTWSMSYETKHKTAIE